MEGCKVKQCEGIFVVRLREKEPIVIEVRMGEKDLTSTWRKALYAGIRLVRFALKALAFPPLIWYSNSVFAVWTEVEK